VASGLDIALRAFQQVLREFPKAEFHIYGDGIMKPSLIELSRELGFNGNVQFFQPLPVKQIADIMANADLGVVPKRADTFGNEAYSTKIMEFMSVGVPVVFPAQRSIASTSTIPSSAFSTPATMKPWLPECSSF
jgi:glycosyltransferase involved in cell wall biosynthesis